MKKKSLSHRTGMRLSSDKGWANYSLQAKKGPWSAFFFLVKFHWNIALPNSIVLPVVPFAL